MTKQTAKKRVIVATPKRSIQLAYPCSACGGDAFIAYTADTKSKTWGGKVNKGERICLPCGKRRGITFFDGMHK